MHRVIAGCNLWAILFLVVAFGLGWSHSPWHQPVGIFAAVFALFSQSAIFALFMGAYWLLKEHVELYSLGEEHVAGAKRIMLPLFAWASVASSFVLLFAILAGLGASGDVPVLVHAVVGVLAIVLLGLALGSEVPGMARMHEVLAAMERSLPVSAERRPGEPLSPPPPRVAPDRRAGALFYVGATVLAMLLGYRFIAGIELPGSLMAVVGGFALLCLGAALALKLSAR